MKFSKLGLLGILFVLFSIGVRVDAEARFTLLNFQVPEKVINRLPTLDQEFQMWVTVTNMGDSSGIYTVKLSIDGNVTSTKRINLNAGESTEVDFSVELFGDPIKAIWPGNEKMTDAIYQIELDGYTTTVSVTPFPDFTVYFTGIDILCVIGVVLFIRWIGSPGQIESRIS
jgi:hypothetical protein